MRSQTVLHVGLGVLANRPDLCSLHGGDTP